MRHFLNIGLLLTSLLTAVACATSTDGDEALNDEEALSVSQPLANHDYTTRGVCKACGCTPTELACDCGLSGPSEKEKECLDNGGPKKAVLVRGVVARPGTIATSYR